MNLTTRSLGQNELLRTSKALSASMLVHYDYREVVKIVPKI